MRFLMLVCILLTGCASEAPEPFETGERVSPPIGCIVGKMEGRDVDC